MKEAYKLAKGNAEDELDPETLQLLEESATEGGNPSGHDKRHRLHYVLLVIYVHHLIQNFT